MSATHNSRLLADLYNTREEKSALEILQEMEEIGDPIFLYPLFNAYERFMGTSISHYFISLISKLKTDNTTHLLLQIISNPKTKASDIIWTYNELIKKGYSSEDMTRNIAVFIAEFAELGGKARYHFSDYNLPNFIEYLKKNEATNDLDKSLILIWENEYIDRDTRSVALDKYLEIFTGQAFDYLLTSYPKYINSKVEQIIAKQLTRWKGKRADLLKSIIQDKGSEIAKEILDKAKKEKEIIDEKKAQKDEERYGNGKIVSEISDLLTKINKTSRNNSKLGVQLFSEAALITTQIKTIVDKPSCVEACTHLRIVMGNMAEGVEHELDQENAKKLCPEIDIHNMNKGLNKLQLFLTKNSFPIPNEFYGLRPIFRAVNLFAHPEKEEDLIDLLKTLGLNDDYKSKNWSRLHTGILNKYRDSLNELLTALNTTPPTNQ